MMTPQDRVADAHVARWDDERTAAMDSLAELLGEFGDCLPDPLRARVDLPIYAAKLMRYGQVLLVSDSANGEPVGLLAMYANDAITRRAHIPIVAVLPSVQGQGIGALMFSRALARARQLGMTTVNLDVDPTNVGAQRLYRRHGFRVLERNDSKLRMAADIVPSLLLDERPPTPVEVHGRLAAAFALDIDLRIKRDDLFPMAGGGIKARKMVHILRDAMERGHDTIVTTGGPQSNHARAAAIMCAMTGMECHLVITPHEERFAQGGNLRMMRLAGASIELGAKDEIAERMDAAMDRYRAKGHTPLYVWGGGHSVVGTHAFVEASHEAQRQCDVWVPDFLVAASGTGSTQAGFAIGYAGSDTRVIGISVARERKRGAEVVRSCVADHMASHGQSGPIPDVEFRDEWTDGGYEHTSAPLWDVIRTAGTAGVFLDPTYTGKAMRGLAELVRSGEIPSASRVLFWHSGGLPNLLAADMPDAGGRS